MLLWIFDTLSDSYSELNVFRYLTFRAICGTLTALTLSLLVGPWMIRKLSLHQVGQTVRDDGPQTHLKKGGTPTMGGALIIVAIAVSTLLWADLSNRFVWVVLLTCIAFGAIGCFDDYRKIVDKNPRGMGARAKFLSSIGLGFGFVVLTYLVVVGTSNAVNLTDGLDGLAIMPCVMVAGALGIFCYATGNFIYSGYLGLPFIQGAGEILIFCAALVGAGLGFLWFNTYPAQVFMGDIGALSLGASLGIVAVVVRQELVLVIMGGIFVIETLSVILQVASFKLTGRRIFKMAPLHHHYELKGWPEPRVSVRFWIISLILVLIGLGTLKVR